MRILRFEFSLQRAVYHCDKATEQYVTPFDGDLYL
jgi:hypothetical protein